MRLVNRNFNSLIRTEVLTFYRPKYFFTIYKPYVGYSVKRNFDNFIIATIKN